MLFINSNLYEDHSDTQDLVGLAKQHSLFNAHVDYIRSREGLSPDDWEFGREDGDALEDLKAFIEYIQANSHPSNGHGEGEVAAVAGLAPVDGGGSAAAENAADGGAAAPAVPADNSHEDEAQAPSDKEASGGERVKKEVEESAFARSNSQQGPVLIEDSPGPSPSQIPSDENDHAKAAKAKAECAAADQSPADLRETNQALEDLRQELIPQALKVDPELAKRQSKTASMMDQANSLVAKVAKAEAAEATRSESGPGSGIILDDDADDEGHDEDAEEPVIRKRPAAAAAAAPARGGRGYRGGRGNRGRGRGGGCKKA